MGPKTIGALITVVLIGAIVMVWTQLAFYDVDTGYATVIVNSWEENPEKRTRLGAVGAAGAAAWQPKTLWEEVHHIYIATKGFRMDEQPGADMGPIAVLSSDTMEIKVDLNFRYIIDPNKAVELYQRYPALNYEPQIINIVRDVVRNVVIEHPAIEAMQKRALLEQPIKDGIKTKVESDQSLVGAITIIGVEVLKTDPPIEFQNAVKNKLKAEQEMQQAEFDANKAEILADGDRRAKIKIAEGLATAKLIEANATQQAIITVVKAMGGDESQAGKLYLQLLTYKEIAQTGTNVIFLIGNDQDGNFFLVPLQPNKDNP